MTGLKRRVVLGIMKFELGQIQSQQQKLIMSPQMKQAIEILQLPLLELRTLIQEELQVNPVLDLEESQEEPLQEETSENSVTENREELDFKEEFDRLANVDEDMKEFFRNSGDFRKYSTENREKREYLESLITRPETIEEYMEFQINIMLDSEKEKHIGKIIIGNLDVNGYLKATVEEISEGSKEPEKKVLRVLEKIQQFEPAGIASRNIKECLLIQLEKKEGNNKIASDIISNHLEQLGKKQFDKVAGALNISLDQVSEAAKVISSLNPKPAVLFEHFDIPYINPDITIEQTEDSGYEIIVNDEYLPRLKISNFYKKAMQDENTDKKIKGYIKDKLSAGKWLIKNIYQRQQTIHNIAKELLEYQKDFFDKGPKHLKPMILQTLASRINVHESTISRAISNKYLQCSWGLYPLKYFFTSSLNTFKGEVVSAQKVKDRIKEVILSEDRHKPLSDDIISDILKKEDIDVARRTVAKYREEMGFLSSRMRKSL